jgi:hypothetical protein
MSDPNRLPKNHKCELRFDSHALSLQCRKMSRFFFIKDLAISGKVHAESNTVARESQAQCMFESHGK